MKVWIVAKTHYKGTACVHALTEANEPIRLLQANGTYPSARTRFEAGQAWDLTVAPSPNRIPPHLEDVIVTGWKQLEPEPDLRAVLLERVQPWRGGPDQLFEGLLRTVMHTTNAFISERDAFPHKSMDYWLPDAPLVAWHDAQGRLCYRYYTPERELITDYTGYARPIFSIPAQTLVHVALHRWWTPANRWAPGESSRVERRCYLYIAAWYLPEGREEKPPRCERAARNHLQSDLQMHIYVAINDSLLP
jgi:putative nucleic acid modification protein with dual OB domain